MPPSDTQNRSRRSTRRSVPELDADYVNESHILAFAQALRADELAGHDTHGASSPIVPSTPRVRKVSALSDFAPVNMKVKRRRRGEKLPHKRQDWLFLLLRWPLLFFIFLFILGEFGLYVIIRQLVNTKEWLSAWRGRKGVLRKRLRAARTYQESLPTYKTRVSLYLPQEWKDAAETLDEFLHFHEWKRVDEDPFYDWKLVRKVKRSLRSLRESKDIRGVLGVLETCMRTNFAGIESVRLYSETFLGTKDLIESLFDEQEKALEFIRESPDLSNDEKRRFFKTVNTNMGTSALCLSGGASFGYYHFGVAKAFLDAGLLPRVITGTSAGGLIASMVCTRTDAELKALLVPELANRITACEEPFSVWIKRFLSTGARFDAVSWARKCSFFTRGSMTFMEAYRRTGRILNISVIPADRHSPTKLLNYLTAPDTVIWSALLASAAVPGILVPVVLMEKLKDGTIVPWSWGSRFKDGSLRVDIPTQALNLYFNVTHPVVSQVNPHVHLFFFAPRGSAGKPVAHRKGKGWRGNFLLSAAEQWLKHELTKNFKVIRDLELLPQLLGQDWSSVFLQRFDGAVTIWPRTRVWDWIRILSDPDPPELERMLHVGQIAAWPKLHMIENRTRIEKQIFLGRQAVRKSLQAKGRSGAQTSPTPDNYSSAPRSSRKSKSPPPESEFPMSVDTDAEAAFANGSRWFYKRGHGAPQANLVPSSAPGNGPSQDPLRSRSIRRKWTQDLLASNGQSSSQRATPEPNTPKTPKTPGHFTTMIPSQAQGLLTRFRTKSYPTLSLPFASFRSGDKTPSVHDDTWSSDSSSENDLMIDDQRRYSHPSAVSFADLDDEGSDVAINY